MEKIVSVDEMRAIEREADSLGLSYAQMMENAGTGLANQINIAYNQLSNKAILALVGSGNNGGDALVAVARLADLGWHCCVYLVRPRVGDDPLVERVKQRAVMVYSANIDNGYNMLLNLLAECTVLVDGVLGTGVRLPLQNDVGACLDCVRQYVINHPRSLHIVAVDCPSGVDCDHGFAADETIPAEYTFTMAAVKPGLLNFPAADLAGKLDVISIGKLSNLKSWNCVDCWLVDADYVTHVLPTRPRNAHKGTFGTASIVAGSISYTGAALLAGEAAYRAGAGLVLMAVPSPLHQVLAGRIPEAIWLPLMHENGFIAENAVDMVIDNLGKATALLVGPGFGLLDTTREFVRRLIAEHKNLSERPPLVIDADGLKLLNGIPGWYQQLPAQSILTPHPGEMSILCGLPVEQVQSDRIGVARKFARLWGQVVVLKGAFTVIASPDGQAAVIPVATPALARAGTGDVLAGLIVGLLAQGVPSYDAAIAGAWIHASAGLMAESKLGAASVLAGDLILMLPMVLSQLNQK